MADARHGDSRNPLIRLAARTFDPIEDEPRDDEQPAGMRSIVQFTRALTSSDRARLQTQFGLMLTRYLPDLAYLEAVPPRVLALLRED